MLDVDNAREFSPDSDETDFARLHSGAVLVCKIPTPAWSELLGIAGAVVTDLGSPHSPRKSSPGNRECLLIVATGKATERLGDGDIVMVNGKRRVILQTMPSRNGSIA